MSDGKASFRGPTESCNAIRQRNLPDVFSEMEQDLVPIRHPSRTVADPLPDSGDLLRFALRDVAICKAKEVSVTLVDAQARKCQSVSVRRNRGIRIVSIAGKPSPLFSFHREKKYTSARFVGLRLRRAISSRESRLDHT